MPKVSICFLAFFALVLNLQLDLFVPKLSKLMEPCKLTAVQIAGDYRLIMHCSMIFCGLRKNLSLQFKPEDGILLVDFL